MKIQKMYEPDDKLINIIGDNYNILQALGCFGINLGFGDKTVREVCEDQKVDTYTFLAVVNFSINGYRGFDDAHRAFAEEADFQESGFDIEDAPEDAGADIDVGFDDE